MSAMGKFSENFNQHIAEFPSAIPECYPVDSLMTTAAEVFTPS